MVNIDNVKHHWLDVATAANVELLAIHKERDKTLSYMKRWVEEALLIGTNQESQYLIYIAFKSSKKENFYKYLGKAIEAQSAYIETLK